MTAVRAIEVREVSYTYPGAAAPSVRQLSFEVARGEIFGLLGPSGAGKSTTQRILVGLQRKYEGTVTVLGRDLRQWDREYYEHVGVSFELPNHYLRLTARENLTLFASFYRMERPGVDSILDAVGLGSEADKQVGAFSKGMRVRLNLARALIHRPTLLFLDEPTAGLDPLNARQVRELLQLSQQAGTTVFISTHDMQTADSLCTRVAFMVDGSIRAIDRPAALKLRHSRREVLVSYGSDDGLDSRLFSLDRLTDDPEFLSLLQRRDIRSIHTLEPSLAEVFVQLTGRGLT